MDSKTLLVIDNYNNLEDKNIEILSRLPIRIIITSRIKSDNFYKVEVGEMNFNCCKELFYRFYNGKKDNNNLEKLIDIAKQHTLTLELIAKTANNSCMSIQEITNKIQSKGLLINELEKVNTSWNNDSTEKTINEILDKLFEISNISKQEEKVLKNLSVLPSVELKINEVVKMLGLKNREVLRGLLKKGWLIEEENFYIRMHDIIREIVQNKNEIQFELIESMLNYFKHKNKIDIYFYNSCVKEILKVYSGREKLILELINKLSMNYKKIGVFNEAINLQKEALKEIRANGNSLEEIRVLNTLMELYGLNYDLSNSEKCALEIEEKLKTGITSKELELFYNNLGLFYLRKYQNEKKVIFFNRSEEYQKKSLEAKQKEKNDVEISKNINNLGSLYRIRGVLEKKMEYFEKSICFLEEAIEMREPFLKKHPMDLARSYNNLGLAFSDSFDLNQDLKRLRKAIELFSKSLEIRKNVLGEEHIDVARIYVNRGKAYLDYKDKNCIIDLEKAIDILVKNKILPEHALFKNASDFLAESSKLYGSGHDK